MFSPCELANQQSKKLWRFKSGRKCKWKSNNEIETRNVRHAVEQIE